MQRQGFICIKHKYLAALKVEPHALLGPIGSNHSNHVRIYIALQHNEPCMLPGMFKTSMLFVDQELAALFHF